MTRTIIAAFIACQCLGELAAWLWPHFSGPFGPFCWVASIFLLLPGDLIAQWILERFLWNSSWSIAGLQTIKMIVEIALNAALWYLIVFCLAKFRHRTAGSSVP